VIVEHQDAAGASCTILRRLHAFNQVVDVATSSNDFLAPLFLKPFKGELGELGAGVPRASG